MLTILKIGRIKMKSYDVILSGRRSVEGVVEVMDIDSADTAIQKAEIMLAQKLGCEVSELLDVQVERCVYIDPGEEADYKSMGEQKTLRDIRNSL